MVWLHWNNPDKTSMHCWDLHYSVYSMDLNEKKEPRAMGMIEHKDTVNNLFYTLSMKYILTVICRIFL